MEKFLEYTLVFVLGGLVFQLLGSFVYGLNIAWLTTNLSLVISLLLHVAIKRQARSHN